MNWWQRWKAKHWDETVVKNDPGSPVIFIGFDRPPLRRLAGWIASHWRDLLTFSAALATIVGAIAAVMALHP